MDVALFEVGEDDDEREEPEAEEGGGACNTTLGAATYCTVVPTLLQVSVTMQTAETPQSH